MVGSRSEGYLELVVFAEDIRERVGVEITRELPVAEMLAAAHEVAIVLQGLCNLENMRRLDEDTREKLLDMVWEQALPQVNRKTIQPATADEQGVT